MTSNSPEYQEQYRAQHPDYAAREKVRNRLRKAARRAVAANHSDEYWTLIEELRMDVSMPTGWVERNRIMSGIRDKAMAVLCEKYPTEYLIAYEALKMKEGVD